MNIKIRDAKGKHDLAHWTKNEFKGLTFAIDHIGGEVSASLSVPVEYAKPYTWASYYNQITVYHKSLPVFSGYISNLDRYWSKEGSGINIDALGWVSKLNKDYTTIDASNERASTYIVDHILVGEVASWIDAKVIETDDYLIPGTLTYFPQKKKREVLDDLFSYNQGTYEWFVRGKYFYWQKRHVSLDYRTTVWEHTEGSLRGGIDNYYKGVRAAYRDLAGAWQAVLVTNTYSNDPTEYWLETYTDNMTLAQATQRATESLNRLSYKGATATVKVKECWTKSGEKLHPSRILPGNIILLQGMIPGQATAAQAYEYNDLDTFVISSIKYNGDDESADLSLGQTLATNLTNLLSGSL